MRKKEDDDYKKDKEYREYQEWKKKNKNKKPVDGCAFLAIVLIVIVLGIIGAIVNKCSGNDTTQHVQQTEQAHVTPCVEIYESKRTNTQRQSQ